MMAIASLQLVSDSATLLAPVILYIGPDVFLPITSALAALAGVLLMFWHRVVGFVARLFGRGQSPKPPDQPGTKHG